MSKRAIGIMGGTFDPIHYGHLIMAEYVYDALHLDKILFIPTGVPPHKRNRIITDKNHRLNITSRGIADNSHFEISTIELARNGRTYSVDTLKELNHQYPDTEFYFIMGADSLLDILKWREPEQLMKLCHLVVVNRAEYSNDDLVNQIEFLKSKYTAKIEVVKIPDIQISSTEIRDRVSKRKSIKYLVPEPVETYILNNDLYF